MTNSRLTDPEVLESRFPVVLEEFGIRRGSGGKGRWHAGDGTLRRLRFREKMDLAILSRSPQRTQLRHGRRRARRTRAQLRAAQRWTSEELEGCAQTVLEAGERIEIVTPTGGGWGKKG